MMMMMVKDSCTEIWFGHHLHCSLSLSFFPIPSSHFGRQACINVTFFFRLFQATAPIPSAIDVQVYSARALDFLGVLFLSWTQ